MRLSFDFVPLAELLFDLFLRQQARAEEPVVALHAFGLVVHLLALHRNDHLVARTPVGRHRHAERVDGLQAHQHALDFVEIAAQRQRTFV